MNDPNFQGKYDVLETELKKTGVVAEIDGITGPLTACIANSMADLTGKEKIQTWIMILLHCRVTHDYGKTVGWKLIEGRDFSKEFCN